VLGAAALAANGADASTNTARRRAIKQRPKRSPKFPGTRRPLPGARTSTRESSTGNLSGWTIGPALADAAELDALNDRGRRRLELAVVDLLAGDHDSSAVVRIAA
jgi:hypothetical protein